MKSRVRLAVLRILSLREEFTDRELSNAVSLVASGKTDDLLTWLAAERRSTSRNSSRNTKSLPEQQSKIIAELRYKEPDRYRLLIELDSLIRKGALLPRLEDVRRLGTRLDKGFEADKSRSEAIPKLMEVLAKEPLDRVQNLLRQVIEEDRSKGGKETEYQKLAAFLIHGK